MTTFRLPSGVVPGSASRLAGYAQPGLSQTAQLRCGVLCQAGYFNERSFRTPQYALVYLYAGSGCYHDHRGRSWPLRPGSVYQRFPNQSHSVEYTAGAVRCFAAVPCQAFELLLLTGAASLERPVFDVGAVPGLVRDFHALRVELGQCREDELAAVLLRVQALILKIHQRGRELSPPPDRRLRQALQLLSENLDTGLRLPDLARRLNMSYSAFRKAFLREHGTSAREFRVRRRVERAMALLRQKDLPLKSIADELGYSDVYAFCAQFKKVTGIPPGTFRKHDEAG